MNTQLSKSLTVLTLAGSLLLSGCFHNDDDDDMMMDSSARYQITVTNLTNNQPLSPPLLVLHGASYMPWDIGTAASDGLELLAEGGDASMLMNEAETDASVKSVYADDMPLAPGSNRSYTLTANPAMTLELTLATMLVNTNDAFTGTANTLIGGLGKGESRVLYGNVYDAGTEDNSETAATIPGPAGGGEGFNVARESRNIVTMHGGVVTQDDGLATSALDQSHRFDNPATRIVVKRL